MIKNMKYLKIAAFLLSATVSVASFAQDKPATATTEVKASVKAKEDRSYVEDYASKKANLVYLVEGKENQVTYKEISGKSVILTDATGANLTIEHGSTTFKFILKAPAEWQKARVAAQRGDVENAISAMRDVVYPLIPLTALSEDAFDSTSYIEPFVSALLEAKLYKEAYAFAKALPVEMAGAGTIKSVMEVAIALANNGEINKAMKLVEKVELRDATQYDASDSVMKAMGLLRSKGKIKDMLPLYTKFGGTKNPQASEFKLWGIYCDVALGNRMSAELYLNEIKVDKNSEAFSLYQLVKGDLRATDPKNPNLMGALDAYAEGIVFGKISSEWMPELLYKAGMTYKALKRFVASNEIFAQISAMYPTDPFAAKGTKEIVKIEKKKVEKEVSHDDDDDDDDDEDDE